MPSFLSQHYNAGNPHVIGTIPLLNLAEKAAKSKNTLPGVCGHERHKREIQADGCKKLFVINI
jgi:hypothetical protein